jgi:hypothetical protein
MKSMLHSFRFVLIALLFSGAAALRAADVTSYGMTAGAVSLPDGLTAAEVQKVILESAIGRGWNIVSKDNEKVVVKLDQEKWSAMLTLIYTAHDVQVYSNSTRSGKPKLPETWIRFLKQDISKKTALLQLAKQ